MAISILSPKCLFSGRYCKRSLHFGPFSVECAWPPCGGGGSGAEGGLLFVFIRIVLMGNSRGGLLFRIFVFFIYNNYIYICLIIYIYIFIILCLCFLYDYIMFIFLLCICDRASNSGGGLHPEGVWTLIWWAPATALGPATGARRPHRPRPGGSPRHAAGRAGPSLPGVPGLCVWTCLWSPSVWMDVVGQDLGLERTPDHTSPSN